MYFQIFSATQSKEVFFWISNEVDLKILIKVQGDYGHHMGTNYSEVR